MLHCRRITCLKMFKNPLRHALRGACRKNDTKLCTGFLPNHATDLRGAARPHVTSNGMMVTIVVARNQMREFFR